MSEMKGIGDDTAMETGPPPISPRKITFPADAVFHSVVQEGDMVEILRILNSNVGNLEINQRNHVGLTALHQAVLQNNMDASKLLLCRGADVNVADVNGFTPLHTSAACGYYQIASLLILFGADLFLLTNEVDLPVDLAKDSHMALLLAGEMCTQIHRKEMWSAWILFHVRETWRALRQYASSLWQTIEENVLKPWLGVGKSNPIKKASISPGNVDNHKARAADKRQL